MVITVSLLTPKAVRLIRNGDFKVRLEEESKENITKLYTWHYGMTTLQRYLISSFKKMTAFAMTEEPSSGSQQIWIQKCL